MKKRIFTGLTTIFMVLGLTSCSQDNAGDNPDKKKESIVPVEIISVERKNVSENAEYTGIVEAKYSVDLVAEVSGKIVSVNKKLGAMVSNRDVIASIDDRIPSANYKQAEAQVITAENNLKIAQRNFNSDKDLFKNGDISKLALDNAELAVRTAEASLLQAKALLSVAKKSYDDTKIISPVSGYIAREYVDLGTMVNQGSQVYRIVDLSTLKVKIGVPQSVIGRLKRGASSIVTISSLNNMKLNGQVDFISPQADERTGTFQAEITIRNNGEIKAGVTASVNLLIKGDNQEISVPDYAVVTRDNKPFVYKVEGDRAKLTPVTLNGTYGQVVVINSGIKEGDKIVVTGLKNLGLNTKINIEK